MLPLWSNISNIYNEEYMHYTAFSCSAKGISGIMLLWPQSLKMQLGFPSCCKPTLLFIIPLFKICIYLASCMYLSSPDIFSKLLVKDWRFFCLHFWAEQSAVWQEHDLLGQEVNHSVLLILQCKDLRGKNKPLHEIHLLKLEWTSLISPKLIKTYRSC